MTAIDSGLHGTPRDAREGARNLSPCPGPGQRPGSRQRQPHLTLVRGTRLATATGALPVEDLAPGMLVMTHAAGLQPVQAVTCLPMARAALIATPRLTPVLIGAGALGCGLPHHDLHLHPWTRLGLDAAMGAATTGRAMDLVGSGRIARVFPDGVEYFNLCLPVTADVQVAGIWLGLEDAAAPMPDPAMPAPGQSRGWRRIGAIIAGGDR